MLGHAYQGASSTCLYHAVYAVTGDPTWLRHAEDARQGPEPDAELPWVFQLAAHGLLVFAHHTTQRAAEGQTTPRVFWEELRARWATADPGVTPWVPLIVTIWGGRAYHAVAVGLPIRGGDVLVSDSARRDLACMRWEEFLDSGYATAYRVEMLVPFAGGPSAGPT